MIETETAAAGGLLVPHQRLATSGARAVLPLAIDGALHLAVPQLALDLPGQPPHMNGGDSDTDLLLFRWRDGRFEADDRLPLPGGEDVLAFAIGEDKFLATAGVRTGRGPYDLNTHAVIYRRSGGAWELVQSIPAFAAKQWHHFSFDGRHFLALAQGVTLDGIAARHPRHSSILEWDGARFVTFQTLEGGWGYNWEFFEHEGQRFLAYADHTSPSRLYRWTDGAFVPFQDFAHQCGRAFRFFESDGGAWLAFANIAGDSVLHRWDGTRFLPHQSLGGPGGREFELIRTGSGLYLVRICFIQGSPAAPTTDLMSQLYRWDGGGFALAGEFPTFGGTDAAAFEADGQRFLAVSNSLTPDIRFRQDTMVYRLAL